MKFTSKSRTAIMLALWAQAAKAKSDCTCIDGFNADDMPKMNVTNFQAAAYPNGTSIYSFDVAYWPDVPPATCQAIVEGEPGIFAPVYSTYCSDKADGSWVPVYWYWALPDANFTLRVESRYLITAKLCNECVEVGTHVVTKGAVGFTSEMAEYVGRKKFVIRPKAVHG